MPEKNLEETALSQFESLKAMLAGAMYFADEHRDGFLHTDLIRKFIKVAEDEG